MSGQPATANGGGLHRQVDSSADDPFPTRGPTLRELSGIGIVRFRGGSAGAASAVAVAVQLVGVYAGHSDGDRFLSGAARSPQLSASPSRCGMQGL